MYLMEIPILPENLEDFGFPTTLAFSEDGKVYLSERITGRLWQIDHEEHRLVKTFPIATLVGHHETGLLGIALDPDFEKNKYLYCFYTVGTNEKNLKNKVVRITDDNRDNKKKETVILDNIPAGMINNGGILAFAPDGKLYIGVGVDNDFKEQSQNTKTLKGQT